MDPTLGQTQPMASSSSSSHPEPLLLPSVSPALPSSSSSSTSSPSPSSRTLASNSPAPARPPKRRRLDYGDIIVKRLEQLDERWQETKEEDGRRVLPPDCVSFGQEMEEKRRVLPPDCVSFGLEMEEKRRVFPPDCVAFGLLVESMVARMGEEERDSAFAEVVALLSEILAQHERREGQLQDTQLNSAAD